MGLSYHTANKEAWEAITNSIPWRPDEQDDQIKKGNWITKPIPGSRIAPEWVYLVLESAPTTAKALEFKKVALSGHIQASTNRPFTIATNQYRPIRILFQEYPGSALEIARDPPDPSKKHRLY